MSRYKLDVTFSGVYIFDIVLISLMIDMGYIFALPFMRFSAFKVANGRSYIHLRTTVFIINMFLGLWSIE